MPPNITIFQALVSGDRVAYGLCEPISGAWNACPDRFAEDEEIRVEVFGAGVPAGACADGVSLVNNQERLVFAGKLAQLLMVASIRMHDADVGHGGFGEHASNISGLKGLFERRHIVEFDHPRGHGRIDGRPYVSAARFGHAVLQGDEGFVHTAVIAPVENQNFWAAGDFAGEADRAIGISGSKSELPVGQAKAPLQFFAHPNRIFAGEHQRNTTSDLLLHGGDGGCGRMAGHGASVAEAEVDVVVAIHV
jgi:hypothetical protein